MIKKEKLYFTIAIALMYTTSKKQKFQYKKLLKGD